MSQPLDLTVRKVIPAAIDTVFDAWLDPAALARFMKPGEGMSDSRVELDAREGGNFLIVMIAGEKEIPHRGEYKTIDRPRRLVFTWLSDFTSEGSTVTIDLVSRGPTETELTLHHIGFPDADSRDSHEGGWAEIIDMLIPVLS
jgi:uncharacterized protein YndB with AHSA1/START domain